VCVCVCVHMLRTVLLVSTFTAEFTVCVYFSLRAVCIVNSLYSRRRVKHQLHPVAPPMVV